jgi:hypothetical protein
MKNIIIVQKRRFSMKKILSTAFAALALSMAVGTVDAKRVKRTRRAQSEPTQRQVTKDIVADANAVKAAPMDEKQARALELANSLLENPELADLARLQLERKKLGLDLETAREKLKITKTGMFFNSDEYKAQKAVVSDINSKLRDKNKQIKDINKDLPQETSYAVYYGVAAVIGAIGVVSALEYWYSGSEGYVGTAITEVGKKATAAKIRAGGLYREYAPERLGGTPRVVTP